MQTFGDASQKISKPHWLPWAPRQALSRLSTKGNDGILKSFVQRGRFYFLLSVSKQACFSQGIKVQKFTDKGNELYSKHYLQDTITLVLKVPNVSLSFPPTVVFNGRQ